MKPLRNFVILLLLLEPFPPASDQWPGLYISIPTRHSPMVGVNFGREEIVFGYWDDRLRVLSSYSLSVELGNQSGDGPGIYFRTPTFCKSLRSL